MSRERDARGRFKKKDGISKNFEEMNTPMRGTISHADIFREQLSSPRRFTRRGLFLLVVGGVAVTTATAAVLAEPVRDIVEGKITTKYGSFWPFYDDEPFSIERLPKDLDYFFIDKPMRAEEYKKSGVQLLATTTFPPGLLEYLAEKGVRIVYADAPGFDDQRLRNALFAHKMLLWTEAKSSTQMGKGRPVKSVFFAESKRKDLLIRGESKDIDSFLARGFSTGRSIGWTESVILSHYKDEVIEFIANASGSIDNLFTVREVTLPSDFRIGDLQNPQRRNLIRVDDSIKDPKLIGFIKQRQNFLPKRSEYRQGDSNP